MEKVTEPQLALGLPIFNCSCLEGPASGEDWLHVEKPASEGEHLSKIKH